MNFLAKTTFLFLIFSGLLAPGNAHAYLDPGSGSFFIQVMIAFLAAIPLTFNLWFRKLLAFLKKLFSGGKK